uniref:GDNF domain-containing protein n=1 Tax=Syphacia muris TaxID=451379 RepID=A0A0N5AN55_9BILA
NVVQVEVYSEAQCGDSTRFTRRQLWPTYQKFEHTRRLQVSVISFGKASCQPEAGDYNCRCQHGQRECDLNQLMNCVQDFYNNDPGKYLPVFACIQGKTDLDYAKDYCIANNPELPLETIMKCTTGRRGRRLLALAGQKTAALQPPLNNVPLIRVNGVKSIDAFYEFEETICNEMQPKPVECTK